MDYIKLCILVLFLFGASSCNRDEVFEKEQYKNVFALVSDNDNVYEMYHDLRLKESTGYISASMGGTKATQRDIVVTLAESQALVDEYNLSNFDVNVTKYVKALPRDKYAIDSYQFTIPAGSIKGTAPIKIRPSGLSPDSIYLIGLFINNYSAYEVNPGKDFVLYKVLTKNWWSVNGGSTYTMRGVKYNNADPEKKTSDVFGTKKIYPLTGNKVRLLAGNESNDVSEKAIFDKYSIIATIGNDDRVVISSYGTINVQQIDGDELYPNIAILEDTGYKTYKTFLLHYSYKGSDGNEYTVKEELRLEFVEDINDPRFLSE